MERGLHNDQKEQKAKYKKIKQFMIATTIGFYVIFAICYLVIDHGLQIYEKTKRGKD